MNVVKEFMDYSDVLTMAEFYNAVDIDYEKAAQIVQKLPGENQSYEN